jgi:hypothetical protein
MKKVLRGGAAVFLGFLSAFVVVGVTELVGMSVFPPPVKIDPNNAESLAAAMKVLPIGALVMVVLAWGLGAFCGAWVSTRISPGRQVIFGYIFGGLFLLATLVNLMGMPHPAWMWIVGLLEIFPLAYLGARLATPRPSSQVLSTA